MTAEMKRKRRNEEYSSTEEYGFNSLEKVDFVNGGFAMFY